MKQKLIFLMMCLAFTLSAVGQGIVTRQKPNGGRTLSATVTRSGDNLVLKVGNVSYTMVYVEGGTFTMGATGEQGSDADDDEKPTHSVTLSSYHMGETEVTQALWQAVMGNLPSDISSSSYDLQGSQRPVCYVSWDDCQTFISKLNSLTGLQFKLPTEAQWKYAARGGNKSRGY